MKSHFNLTLVFLTCFAASRGVGAEFSKDELSLSCKLKDSSTVKIVLQKTKIDQGFPYKDASLWGGEWEMLGNKEKVIMPKEVMKAIIVVVEEEIILVPMSAFSDLGDPDQVSVVSTAEGFALTISGGETASSYTAIIEFSKESILRKKVSLGEFPDQVWQEISYSFISSDSDM